MLPVVLVKVTVPALTAPLKLVPAELVIVRSPLPANEVPAIVPAVPPFRVKPLPALLTAPIVIVLPAKDAVAPLLVVSSVVEPPKVTAPKVIASAPVATVPLIVVVLAVDVKPPVNTLVPLSVTPPVLEKVAALVIVLPAFSSTL